MRYFFRVSVVLLILSMAFFVCLAEEHVILTIHNECVSDDLLSSFMREHPSIRIEEHNDPEDSNITIEEALSHSDNVDIYFMNTLTSRTYEALRDRGYFLELTDPEILAMANSIYSEVRKAAIYNDNLCALPYEIQGQPVFAVDMNIWLSLGFSKDELPRTWADLLRFCTEKWPSISMEHEEIALFSEFDIDAADLLGRIEKNYEAYRTIHDYNIGYDTPEFREVLELFSRMCELEIFNTTDQTESYLFDSFYIPSLWGFSSADARFLRLSFLEDDQPCYPVGIKVMAINPNSKHVAESIELIKYVFNNVGLREQMELCPEMNDPVIDENYLIVQQEYLDRMDLYEQQINQATDEVEQRTIGIERDAYDKEVQNYFSKYKYIAGVDQIQKYRKDVQGTMVPIYATALTNDDYSAVNDFREAFLRGELPEDIYIRELEHRLVFSTLENQ